MLRVRTATPSPEVPGISHDQPLRYHLNGRSRVTASDTISSL